jgi:DNA-binding NarL/FixJ family response regulator
VTILALQSYPKIVGQARDGEEACLLYDELSPDILILDLRMPTKNGQEVANELTSQRPRARIIVVTDSAKAEDPPARANGVGLKVTIPSRRLSASIFAAIHLTSFLESLTRIRHR